MMHRIREAWACDGHNGPFDETYMGGTRKNKSNLERKHAEGRGAVDMTAVVGATDQATLQGFVADSAGDDAVVYTDDALAYQSIPNPHETVQHSVSEFVNGIESF